MTTPGLTGRALGEAVIDHVLTYPETHDQEAVMCGTSACIAGWAILLHYGIQSNGEHLGTRLYDSAYGRVLDPAEWHAPDLLGVDRDLFRNAVFGEMNRDTAISNLKHLLDESHAQL